jgi:hypothetical protein
VWISIGIAWIFAPIDRDDLPCLQLHAGAQRPKGSGVAQLPMKELA